ncbi:type II secretion system protein [Thiomicrorhabdus sp. ZW0627]|uniref:type II secretion system protein n=1 Tax=Thiomicrorhabdus sp. ZW0627 TaxID=3039774 RepID=UPI00243715EF|nr:type II secretion system protein [Thiomicrorhabdus sp. ZW0627]MDG6774775.1 type II secretion system protein [Thiomicrorhabdus sp. ZW0627]
MKKTMVKNLRGFTLVEIAIVLAIIGLVFGAGFTTLGAYIDNANQSHTMGNLQVTKRAMLDYVLVNRHMPCPDTDNDGVENRTGIACTSSKGTVPFDDLGLGFDVTSDDYGNVFAYGINTDATNAVAIVNSANSASYFGNQSPPAFTLQTPPTTDVPAVPESYTVCKKSATGCDITPSNIEVSAIPAVIVAYNENGGSTSLTTCNAETGKEAENCNNDLFLWKSYFNRADYDDQMVTISGYEIKQQILDLLNNISLTYDDSKYDGYDVIIRGDVDSSNDLNVGTGENNAFYIDAGTDEFGNPEEGNLNAAVQLKDGDDKLYVTANIEAGGKADTGSGNDTLEIGGNIEDGGVATMGTGNDTLIIWGNVAANGSADLGGGNDTFTIAGGVLYRGSVDLGTGDDTSTIGGSVGGVLATGSGIDTIVVEGDVTGTVKLEDDNDTITVLGDVVGGTLDGGAGDDTLLVTSTQAEWDAVIAAEGGTVINFEHILYEQPAP